MTRFIKTLVLFSLPFVLLLAAYIITDPFKVVWDYDNYYPTGKSDGISLNPSHVATRNYLKRQPREHYDAFIFGNSRSMYYPIADWQKHLPSGSRCYHFDAAAESLQGIWDKVRLIDDKGDSLRSVLFVCDADLLSRIQSPHWHLCESDPALTGYSNWASFHWYNFRAFLNVRYLWALIDYRTFHTLRPYMLKNHLLSEDLFNYNPQTNECDFQPMEEQIASGGYYTPLRVSQFQDAQFPDSVSPSVLKTQHMRLLDSIANVFRKHHTQCHIIISPLYNQIRLNPSDVQALQERFGAQNVHDFSGPNPWNADYHNYFETSHYRTHVARQMLSQLP